MILPKLGEFFSKIVSKYLPDTIVLAIFLTLVAYFLGIIIMGENPLSMLILWGGSIWNMLAYTMQIAMVLLTGIVFAKTKQIQMILNAISRLARSPRQAVWLAGIVGFISCWIHWGFGLIVSALFAKEIGRKIKGVHFPLVCAAGYAGQGIWHSGLSGSSTLVIATEGHFLQDIMGIVPMSQTTFSAYNLTIVAIMFVSLPILMSLMHPEPEKVREFVETEEQIAAEKAKQVVPDKSKMFWAERVDNNRIVSLVLGVPMFIYIVHYFATGGSLGLDSLNIVFFSLGIIFTGTPRQVVDECVDAGRATANVLIQYPLYAGIMGMMIASGLAEVLTGAIVAGSSPAQLGVFTFISAGILNLFVPGGGAQWIVQGPIFIPAAQQLGVPVERIVMSFAWGDTWTNMLQPFWALPLLAVAGLGVRDIMGYCLILLGWIFAVVAIVATVFPL